MALDLTTSRAHAKAMTTKYSLIVQKIAMIKMLVADSGCKMPALMPVAAASAGVPIATAFCPPTTESAGDATTLTSETLKAGEVKPALLSIVLPADDATEEEAVLAARTRNHETENRTVYAMFITESMR